MKIQQELTKLYYSISEVAAMFNVSNSLIRYWETEFTSLKPKKNRKGDRRYTEKDIRNLERIYTLVKERGFTLDGAKNELKKKRQSASDKPIPKDELINKLLSLRSKIQQFKSKL
jgi:DNA-binding transcriptional MerR regulator